ncbi:Lrp/AsnC family transcriptional regulator [Rhodococcus sp. NM-2]|jgi:DNA-binding Lrp family transcriptional regulator|uniref:Lrp/AsnC family transcriptional regulator n=1 Tax=Rhodococcus sp. NM-2 TaxID=3401174 RepID=UPI003AAD43DD
MIDARDTILSEEDRRLIHALQIAPRAPWTALAPVLGVDAVTIARRWSRLQSEGLAWVTAYPATAERVLALIELKCPPGRTRAVADEIGRDREAITIDLTTGGRDLLVTTAFEDHEQLSDYLLERMGSLDGISDMTTHVLTGIHTDARSWRLRALDSTEAAAVQQLAGSAPAPRRLRAHPRDEAEILRELATDGRLPATEIASRLSLSVDSTRASMNSLLASGRAVIRTEVARRHSGRPAYAWYFLKSPARSMDQVLDRLATLSDVRLLAPTIGPYSIIMAMWLRNLDEVRKLETVIEQHCPDVIIEDRSLVLRTPKHLGRRLTATGQTSHG